jgi:pilus assembly protein CpaC
VSPEVSALDFTSGLVVQGFTIPALTVRKMSTEIELNNGQSFAIGGLIDNQLTETIAKIPLLGDLPLVGKLFQSISRSRNNTELLVIVTPELVLPASSGQSVPEMKLPRPMSWPRAVPQPEITPVPQETPADAVIPFETLMHSLEPGLEKAAPIPQPLGQSPATQQKPPLN